MTARKFLSHPIRGLFLLQSLTATTLMLGQIMCLQLQKAPHQAERGSVFTQERQMLKLHLVVLCCLLVTTSMLLTPILNKIIGKLQIMSLLYQTLSLEYIHVEKRRIGAA